MDTKGGKWWGGGDGGVMNWEIGIDMYTLICIKQMTNKNLLYKKINEIKFKKKKGRRLCCHEMTIMQTLQKPWVMFVMYLWFWTTN